MTSMRPGQLHPNELELAILERIAKEQPSIRRHVGRLHVLSRKYTGVGSFTDFRCEDPAPGASEEQLGLNALIDMPGVPNGMGAVLFCRGDQPTCLETYTYGDDLWDGVFEGFSIREEI